MEAIKTHNNRLIIQIGETYNLEGKQYIVVTATTKIVDGGADSLHTTEMLYWLKDVETGGMRYERESVLNQELPKYNEVV